MTTGPPRPDAAPAMLSDRWWEGMEHIQDPTEPKECMCGLSWPCAIGILTTERDQLRNDNYRLATTLHQIWYTVDNLLPIMAAQPAPGSEDERA